jgi:hypothetical protein
VVNGKGKKSCLSKGYAGFGEVSLTTNENHLVTMIARLAGLQHARKAQQRPPFPKAAAVGKKR